MKKWMILVLVTAIVSCLLFYSYQISHKVKITSLESIVPEEVIYYIYSYNLNKKIKDFNSGTFFEQVSTSSVYKKFIIPKLEKIKQKMPLLSDIIEKDTALAIFSLGNMETHKRDIVDFGDFLFLARIDAKRQAQIKKSIADIYLFFTTKGETTYKKYKGIKITSYRLPQMQMTISYTLLSDVFIFSNNIDIVQKSIDLFRNQSQSSLFNNKNFHKLTTRIKTDSLLWVYGDTKRYYQEVLRAYTYSSLRSKEIRDVKFTESFIKMKPFINLINISEGYISYLDYDELKSGFIFRAYQTFNRAMDTENLLNIIAYNKEVDKNTFNLVPRGVVAYCGGSQDLRNLWIFMNKISSAMDELMKVQIKSDPRYDRYKEQIENMTFENIRNKLESFLGVNIERDIVSLLGNNFGMIFFGFEDMDMKQTMPFIVPQFYSLCELKDSLKMQEVMGTITQRLINNINQFIQENEQKAKEAYNPSLKQEQNVEAKKFLSLKTDEYRGINIYTIDMADFPIDLLRPNYCILDKYIIFSLSPLLTRKIIDTYEDKQGSFSLSLNFELAQDKILSNYSNIIFFDLERLIDNIRATKFFNELQFRLIKTPPQKIAKEDLDAILNILSNVSSFTFTNKMFDTDTMESSFYIRIKGL